MRLDLLVRAGTILTMDEARPTAREMGIIGGRIVGFDEELAGCTADRTEDFGDAAITPGFIDAHCHTTWWGLGLAALDLSAARGLEELYALLESEMQRAGRPARRVAQRHRLQPQEPRRPVPGHQAPRCDHRGPPAVPAPRLGARLDHQHRHAAPGRGAGAGLRQPRGRRRGARRAGGPHRAGRGIGPGHSSRRCCCPTRWTRSSAPWMRQPRATRPRASPPSPRPASAAAGSATPPSRSPPTSRPWPPGSCMPAPSSCRRSTRCARQDSHASDAHGTGTGHGTGPGHHRGIRQRAPLPGSGQGVHGRIAPGRHRRGDRGLLRAPAQHRLPAR